VSIVDSVRKFMDELASDPVEERVVEYVIREVHNGRKLSEALKDPYVRNRLSAEKLDHVLANAEVVSALEEQIADSFRTHEFGFAD
jgi:hypothetical protein